MGWHYRNGAVGRAPECPYVLSEVVHFLMECSGALASLQGRRGGVAVAVSWGKEARGFLFPGRYSGCCSLGRMLHLLFIGWINIVFTASMDNYCICFFYG